MISTKAWHLRQDGKAFPVEVHLYAMEDEDLSSEAEVASFLIKTQSKDIDLAEFVLDAWMAMLIEPYVIDEDTEDRIESAIRKSLSQYGPVGFQDDYVLSEDELIQIHRKQCKRSYSDVDSLYEFLEKLQPNLPNIQTAIRQSINQQFCRVRYGGKFDSYPGDTSIWFRISSVGYNWDNTIYMFVSEMKSKLSLQKISICRDAESDTGQMKKSADMFYKAKDGSLYFDMPIQEFLSEEHESSPVFSSTDTNINRGVLATIRNELAKGDTLNHILATISSEGIDLNQIGYRPDNLWRYIMKDECVYSCFQIESNVDAKLKTVADMIVNRLGDIDNVKLSYNTDKSEDMKTIDVVLESNSNELLDHMSFLLVLPKSASDLTENQIARLLFRGIYRMYVR